MAAKTIVDFANLIKDYTYSNITDIYKVMGEMGAKNLNSTPYFIIDTRGNVTATENSDGSITLTGLSNADSSFDIHPRLPRTEKKGCELYIGKGKYIFSLSGENLDLGKLAVAYTKNGSFTSIAESEAITGNGGNVEFEITDDIIQNADYTENGKVLLAVYINFKNNVNYNCRVYPMIYNAKDTDGTYVPYAMTNKELTDTILDFMPGDVYSISLDGRASFCGHITNGGKDLYISIPTLKRFTASLINNITLSFSNNATIIVRGISGYVINNDLTSNYNFSVVKAGTSLNELTLLITNTDNSVFNVLNNTPLSGTINGTLTFTFA